MNDTSSVEARGFHWRQVLLWAIGAAALLAVVYFGGRALLARNGPVRLVVYAPQLDLETIGPLSNRSP